MLEKGFLSGSREKEREKNRPSPVPKLLIYGGVIAAAASLVMMMADIGDIQRIKCYWIPLMCLGGVILTIGLALSFFRSRRR